MINQEIVHFILSKSNPGDFPYYIYQKDRIEKQCASFKNLEYSPKSIHFASMANANPEFLALIREKGINIFVNSSDHLDLAIEIGFSPTQVVFTASAMPLHLMKKVYDLGVSVNLDSPNQLSIWRKHFYDKPVGIRVNLGGNIKPYSNHAGAFIGKNSRLGFTIDEIEGIEHKSSINGLHLYSGTDIMNIEYLVQCYHELIKIGKLFPNLEYLNFGGGFGIPENGEEQFDFHQYDKRLSAIMAHAGKVLGNKKIKLYLEPGRIIGGVAGFFVAAVSDLKYREDLQLVGLNASAVQFSRPLLYPQVARHPISIIREGKEIMDTKLLNSSVYGCSTYSRDFFAENRLLPQLEIGDIIIFGNAGSYSASSYLSFLGFPKPKEYFI